MDNIIYILYVPLTKKVKLLRWCFPFTSGCAKTPSKLFLINKYMFFFNSPKEEKIDPIMNTVLISLTTGRTLCVCVCSVVPTLCSPVDCRPLGSSLHRTFQARILEWVAVSFSRGVSQPKYQTQVSCTAGRFFTTELLGLPRMPFSSVQFSRSVLSDSLQPHESQHARPPCPSQTLGVHPNPCP